MERAAIGAFKLRIGNLISAFKAMDRVLVLLDSHIHPNYVRDADNLSVMAASGDLLRHVIRLWGVTIRWVDVLLGKLFILLGIVGSIAWAQWASVV